MARNFWFQALQSQAVTSLRFVHCRPPWFSRFSRSRGDIRTARRRTHRRAAPRSRRRRRDLLRNRREHPASLARV